LNYSPKEDESTKDTKMEKERAQILWQTGAGERYTAKGTVLKLFTLSLQKRPNWPEIC
jgi:hypothetical protein